ncbi:hypothetical protein V6N13_059815 [Hibiscus sabdariffa]
MQHTSHLIWRRKLGRTVGCSRRRRSYRWLKGNKFSLLNMFSPVGVKEMQRSYFWRKGHGRTTSDGFSFGEESGGKRGGKEGLQQGLKVRKPPDTRTISWPVLTEWVDGVNVQLNATASSSVHDPGGFVRAIVNQDGIQCLNTSPCYNNENIL